MVSLYHSGGFEEYLFDEGFVDLLLKERLLVRSGIIVSAQIFGRKMCSNKGNGLDGFISLGGASRVGLNIGGNPIGTGYTNYIPFLEEMGCQKSWILGLYDVGSLVGKLILVLMRDGEWVRGFMSPQSFTEQRMSSLERLCRERIERVKRG